MTFQPIRKTFTAPHEVISGLVGPESAVVESLFNLSCEGSVAADQLTWEDVRSEFVEKGDAETVNVTSRGGCSPEPVWDVQCPAGLHEPFLI